MRVVMPAESIKDSRLEIAHVLFLDIVGYSKLLTNEQRERQQELNRIVRQTGQFQAAEAEGKLVRIPTGDGMVLAFFTSPDAPVRCAVAISRALVGMTHLPLRMGIHSGPVDLVEDVNDKLNLAGAGVNMAQRVMDCGDAGHILVSKHVADDLEHYAHWQPLLHDLGECEVKHGVRIGIVNLHRDGIGDPQIPKKFRQAKAAQVAKLWKIGAAVLVFGLLLAGGFYYRSHQTKPLTDKDTIVLADFTNTTGDPVFDGTLRQGLASQLEQSPFLSLVSDSRIAQILTLMSQPKDARLTPELARAVGQRSGSAATIEGSISALGNQYVLGLKAVDCRIGDLLAQEQVTAGGKEQVLGALGEAANKLRRKVGENVL